jgi:hypothetical protein
MADVFLKTGSFKDDYPKVENLGIDFLKDSRIICNLIFAIQQVTIMQGAFTKGHNGFLGRLVILSITSFTVSIQLWLLFQNQLVSHDIL